MPIVSAVDDVDLLNRARAGERSAYDAVMAAWLRRVAAVVRAQLGDRPEADDAIQDTFIIAWNRLDQLSKPEAFGSWLMAIARTTAAGWGRKLGRRHDYELRDNDHVHTPEGEGDNQHSERGNVLIVAMATLTPGQREILYLKYEAELNYLEIAASLGISRDAVEKRLWRARQALLAAMTKLGES